MALALATPIALHAAIGSRIFPGFGHDALVLVAGLTHAALYTALGLLFGLSLRPGHVALGAALAARAEPCPTPELLAYARAVTWGWTAFCAVQLAGSALLAALAPIAVWSAWVNLIDLPSVGLLFLLEYAVRRVRFRHQPLATLRHSFAVTWSRLARRPP